MTRWAEMRTTKSQAYRMAVVVALSLAVTVTCCAAPPGVDANVPLDVAGERLRTELAVFIGIASLGVLAPLSLNILYGNMAYQDFLRTCRLLEDDRLLAAYTQAQMADLHQSLRQATAASQYLVQKLEDDLRWYVEQNGALTMPNYKGRTGAEREQQEKYKAIQEFLAANRDKILAAQQPVLTIMLDVQKAMGQAGGGVATGGDRVNRLKLGSARIVEALVNYQRLMAEVTKDYKEKIVLTEASPQQHLKLTFYNSSEYTDREWANADDPNAAVVFFVRIWERDRNGGYPAPREDTKSWIPIYPTGMNVQLGDTDESQTVVTLPNEIWLPAKLRDKVEVRVASFGMHRDRIRFQSLDVTGNLRPDRVSLRRGFYFDGYDFKRPTGGTIISHWYAKDEDYQWRFRGGWAPGNSAFDPEYYMPPTPDELEQKYKQIRVDMTRYASELTLVRDHVVWYLPASYDAVKGDPNCEAFVHGTVAFNKRGPASHSPIREFKETVTDAPFSFTMRTW